MEKEEKEVKDEGDNLLIAVLPQMFKAACIISQQPTRLTHIIDYL